MIRTTTGLSDRQHDRPFMRMVWQLLESAKDAGITDVAAACRRAIASNRIGERVDAQNATIIHEAYADLRDNFGYQDLNRRLDPSRPAWPGRWGLHRDDQRRSP
jgi:hypothetical protein